MSDRELTPMGANADSACECSVCERSRALVRTIEGARLSAKERGALLDVVADWWTAVHGKGGTRMRVIMFKDRFAELVVAGVKRQTVRREARCKVGDVLSLRKWSGKPYRSKQTVLGQAICTGVQEVRITADGVMIGVTRIDETDFSNRDGFTSFAEMLAWFGEVHGLPFYGEVISWGELQ